MGTELTGRRACADDGRQRNKDAQLHKIRDSSD
jgi:hypothetical protein